jgi:Protein of unknown function (DUF3592)
MAAREHPLTAAYAGVLLVIFGVGLGVYVWELNRREAEQITGWERTDGSVAAVFGSGSSTRAMVSFKTPTGDRINFTARPAMFYRLKPGDGVSVIYPPFNPTHAAIDPARARRRRNLIAGIASALLVMLGAYVAWYARGRVLDVRSARSPTDP